MAQFTNKVAIVTGGASGIGKAVSEALVRQGAKVIVADINITQLDPEKEKIQAIKVDVSNAAEVQALVDQVVQEYGRLDYIFNNAGFAISGELRDMTPELWNKILDVNLKGVIHGVLAAYPVMIKQGSGHIVNTASLAGLIPAMPIAAYSTTKHAVVGLSTNLRVEAAGYGVKVSVICPGFINTGIYDAAIQLKPIQNERTTSLPFKLVEVDKAAQLILEGVERNKLIIIFPTYAKVLWWLQRLCPPLLRPLGNRIISEYRKTSRS